MFENIDGATLIGLGTVLGAVVSALTWWLTKRTQESDEGRGLIEDALTVQRATHTAYEEAQEELSLIRDEMQLIRAEAVALRKEMVHYRTVAREAREEYVKLEGSEPSWWRQFVPASS